MRPTRPSAGQQQVVVALAVASFGLEGAAYLGTIGSIPMGLATLLGVAAPIVALVSLAIIGVVLRSRGLRRWEPDWQLALAILAAALTGLPPVLLLGFRLLCPYGCIGNSY